MDTRKKIIIAVVIVAALIGAYFLFAAPKTDEEKAAAAAGGASPAPGAATGPSANPLTSPQPGVGVTAGTAPAPGVSAGNVDLSQIQSSSQATIPGIGTVKIITQGDIDGNKDAVGWNKHMAYIIGTKVITPGSPDFPIISEKVYAFFKAWKAKMMGGNV
jgi:hypothetical protein